VDARILEVGSRNVNGSVRTVLESRASEYIGIDLCDGPGVDLVLPVANLQDRFSDERFDVVISTEVLEHCHNWQETLYQMSTVLRQRGLLIITTRSPGFELHDYPGDYWRFSQGDFLEIFVPIGEVLLLKDDLTLGWPCGVGIAVRKTADQAMLTGWHEQIRRRAVYSMATERDETRIQGERSAPMIFDQFSRYQACSDLLRQTGLQPGSSILDVGSGPECLFGRFLPEMSISYVDPLIPLGSNDRNITGTVFAEGLNGRTFECVTAVDVLEHVLPEHRRSFLERVSSLSTHILALGFPTSDSSEANETDRAIDEQYRKVTGNAYPWLKDHNTYGLPSLKETIVSLNDLGWHCQVIGHGHAPWLRDLLAFVICIWDHPGAQPLVLEVSEKFNRELYPYDFRPPYYRQFIIAGRSPIPQIVPPSTADVGSAERRFQSLVTDVREQYFEASLRMLSVVESERDAAVAERDATAVDCEAQIQAILNSHSWKLTRPLRVMSQWLRGGPPQ